MHGTHGGVLCYLLGSVMSDLVSSVYEGSIEQRHAQLWTDIQNAYNTLETPYRLNHLTRTMYHHGGTDYVQLRGVECSQMKHLLPVL